MIRYGNHVRIRGESRVEGRIEMGDTERRADLKEEDMS